jgi:hypothetical protein
LTLSSKCEYDADVEVWMLSGGLFQAVSLLLAFILPTSMIAADSVGLMLIPSGDLYVNGSGSTRPQALFNGDRIQTTQTSGMITMPGSSIQIAPASDVKVSRSDVQVFDGEAFIRTGGELGAHIANLTVHPNATARYSVARRDNTIVIGALEGMVQVTDGRQSRTVPTGKALIAKLGSSNSANTQDTQSQTSTTGQGSQTTQPTSDQNQHRRRRRGAGGGAIPGAEVPLTLSSAELRAIGIGVAAGGAALAIIVTNRTVTRDK